MINTPNIHTNSTLPEPPKKGEDKIVVNQIHLRSADRSRKDIGDWKQALITAESVYMPNRARLYDLYSDILIDGHLSGIMAKRVESVLNKAIHFENAKGQRVEEMDNLISSLAFRNLKKEILHTNFWGISGIEFIPGESFQFKKIPRKHIKPKWGVISYEQNGTEGIEYQDNPNLWIIGEADDLGLLLKCAPYALLKRGNLADWGQFIEIFGQPMRVIKYDAYDRQAKVELKEVLDESGSSLALLIPKTADFEIMDGKQTNANGDLQDKFKDALNDEMSVCILGNVETTGNSNGGSLAKAETQREDQLEFVKSDITYLAGMLNSAEFLAVLKSYGYPTEGGQFVFDKEVNLDEIMRQMQLAQSAKAMGVPIDDDYIYDLTGIPRPDNYDDIKARSTAIAAMTAQGVQDKEGDGEVKNKEEGEEPADLVDNLWNRIRLKLADFFDPAP